MYQTVYDTMTDTCQYAFIQTHRSTTPRVNSSVNYGLWVKMMYQCRFIDNNECAVVEVGVDNGGSCARFGVGDGWNSVLSLSFAVNINFL